MTTSTFLHQGSGISKDERRLQRRSWGTWVVGLFFLAVVISEHPAWAIFEYTAVDAAAFWADRTSLVGSLVALLTIPFALDRVRRQQVAPIEFSKPFEKIAYVLGKFAGALLPLIIVVAGSMVIHFGITIATLGTPLAATGILYIKQALLIALPPLFVTAGLTYCLSVFIRRPLIIIPIYLFYLILTTVTQAAADAQFSWVSPIVRPEYFNGAIPPEWIPTVIAHQLLYLALTVGALVLAVYGFQRTRFIDNAPKVRQWRWRHLPRFPRVDTKMRLLWGGHMVAALLMAFIAVANTMSNPETIADLRINYALFGLEFYLPLCGLLILAGILARDKGIGALDLVVTKPVNRWRLLWDRLLPALTVFGVVCVISVGLLHVLYEPLPIGKALLVSVSTGVYLGMIGMTAANVTRNALAGYGVGMLFWFFEAGFDGRFTAPFYLFIVSSQVDSAAGEIWFNPTIWLPVKIGILLFSIWLFILNGWLIDAGRMQRRALAILGATIPIIYLLGWLIVPLFV